MVQILGQVKCINLFPAVNSRSGVHFLVGLAQETAGIVPATDHTTYAYRNFARRSKLGDSAEDK